MIINAQTNLIYLSSLLKERYPQFWIDLELILKKHSIKHKWIHNTRDIWCRDYMPIQLSIDEYVQFKFFPDYYLDYDYIYFLTLQYELDYTEFGSSKFINLIVDGGNIVKSADRVIMTEKVFKENKNREKKTINKMLKKALRIDELIFIPVQPNDPTGHADGMVRFYDENTVLVNEFTESPSWNERLYKALRKAGLEIIPFPYQATTKKKNQEYTAHGCYINFSQIGNELYPSPEYQVETIDADSISYNGGVLNCCIWNISRPIVRNAIDYILPVYRLGDDVLVIHNDDYHGEPIDDTVCIKLLLDKEEHFPPWSLAKHLKFGDGYSEVSSPTEINEIRQSICKSFDPEDISDIYSILNDPSGDVKSQLVSIPERLRVSKTKK